MLVGSAQPIPLFAYSWATPHVSLSSLLNKGRVRKISAPTYMGKALWGMSKGKAAWGHQGRTQKQQKASFVL